jgi:glutaredoxin
MYHRTSSCPFVTLAKRVLKDYQVAYHEIFIDKDEIARLRVLEWTGFLAVPTLVVARKGDVLPIEPPSFLDKGRSPRGIDRGHMITEPSEDELSAWLLKHGFIAEVARD